MQGKSWSERVARRRALHALGFASYEAYLLSNHWVAFRRSVLGAQRADLSRNECSVCHEAGTSLHLHHKTYERLGRELVSDVQIICEACHDKLHGRVPGSDPRTRAHDYAGGQQ